VLGLLAAIAATLGSSSAGAAGAASTTTTTATTTTTVAPPKNTQPPSVTGTPQEGQKLVGHRGTWSGVSDYNDYWVRCDKDGGSCANISGATDRNGYILKSVDVGNTIRFKVEAKNSGGTTTRSSTPTAVIRAGQTPPPTPANGCPSGTGTIQIAQVSSPARLTIDRQDISPPIIGGSTQQLQVRFHVSACKGRSVQGGLVYVTAVPFQQFSIPPETQTGPDGWAVMTMTRLHGFPAATHQQLLVIFARARKAGDDVLGGVSTRRLVSFRVDLNR
jgi:hypothetical protein